MNIEKIIINLKSLLTKAAPLPWTSGGNIPFYVDLKKPRPSMSKHDHKRPTYWDYNDGAYLLYAVNSVPTLISYIESLEKELSELKKSINQNKGEHQ